TDRRWRAPRRGDRRAGRDCPGGRPPRRPGTPRRLGDGRLGLAVRRELAPDPAHRSGPRGRLRRAVPTAGGWRRTAPDSPRRLWLHLVGDRTADGTALAGRRGAPLVRRGGPRRVCRVRRVRPPWRDAGSPPRLAGGGGSAPLRGGREAKRRGRRGGRPARGGA